MFNFANQTGPRGAEEQIRLRLHNDQRNVGGSDLHASKTPRSAQREMASRGEGSAFTLKILHIKLDITSC